MGSYWLRDLPDVIGNAGLRYRTWPGWENRARSSGGYDQVWAVFAHHTASKTSPDNDCSYMWDDDGTSDQPIGALLLDRTGLITIGAAGATNTQGKGGPWSLSKGTIALDKGNAYGIAVEAANNGVGEAWPKAQTDVYPRLVAALCDAYGLDVDRDVLAHFEWCQPSCPGRKVDPVGPSPWASGAQSWNMDAFRTAAAGSPSPQPEPPEEDDDMLFIAKFKSNPNLVFIGNGVQAQRVRSAMIDVIDAAMTNGVSKWHHPHKAGFPLCNDYSEIVAFTEAQVRAYVGLETKESYDEAADG